MKNPDRGNTAQWLADADLLYPLTLFCQNDGHPLPPFDVIEGGEMPEPYRKLLVHNGDMTSRLETYFRSPLRLRVLHRESTPDLYRREVLLCTRHEDLPVEYGAIEIHLAAFAPELRALILEAREPLGALLNSHGVVYRSEPGAFIRLAPDAEMNALFGTDPVNELYGRCNMLLGGQGETLARIVEVLRPLGKVAA